MKHFLSITLKNQEDVLVRFLGLCYKRMISVESLSYAPEFNTDNVRIMVIIKCSPHEAERLRLQTLRLISVVDSNVYSIKNDLIIEEI